MRIAVAILGALLWPVLCWGQNPAELFEKAPPDIDEALRARVRKFYDLHVEGKFRAADELVAEDSKDVFFGADKQRCRAFTIATISYSENFTKASVLTVCETEMMMPPVGMIPVKMPVRSLWKVIDGQWFWYVQPGPPANPIASAFGLPGAAQPAPQPSSGSPPAPFAFPMAPVDVAAVQNAVRADRRQVTFSQGAKAEERITFTNSLPGSVDLSLAPAKLPGLEMKLDKQEIVKGETATLTIRYQPEEGLKPSPTVVKVIVSPVQQEIPIQIEFK